MVLFAWEVEKHAKITLKKVQTHALLLHGERKRSRMHEILE